MSSSAKNLFLTLSRNCRAPMTSKIQITFRSIVRTDNGVLWFFKISSLFVLSRSRDPLLTFLLYMALHATMFGWPWKTRSTYVYGSEGTRMYTPIYWWLCRMDFQTFFNIYVFEFNEFIADFPAKLSLTCLGDSKIQVKFQFRRYSEVLIVFYGFLYYDHFSMLKNCILFRSSMAHR